MKNCWILVASKKNVLEGIAGSFAQANHGKSHPLRRMGVGDGIIYYSPKQEYGGTVPYQRFTAIGYVVGENLYQVDMGNNVTPNRREVKYLNSHETSITPLINRLTFIKDKSRWGSVFRFGILHIPADDFKLIAALMLK